MRGRRGPPARSVYPGQYSRVSIYPGLGAYPFPFPGPGHIPVAGDLIRAPIQAKNNKKHTSPRIRAGTGTHWGWGGANKKIRNRLEHNLAILRVQCSKESSVRSESPTPREKWGKKIYIYIYMYMSTHSSPAGTLFALARSAGGEQKVWRAATYSKDGTTMQHHNRNLQEATRRKKDSQPRSLWPGGTK